MAEVTSPSPKESKVRAINLLPGKPQAFLGTRSWNMLQIISI
jgi:hypothetical protein